MATLGKAADIPTRDLGNAQAAAQGVESSQKEGPADQETISPFKGEPGRLEKTPLDQERLSEDFDAETFPFLDPPIDAGELGWLAHYRVVRLVGVGGMGLVFLAEDPRLQRPVALKVMRPDLALNDTARQRFLREARATAAIRSEHIIAIHEVGQVKDLPYLVTDFLHGKPLDSCLRHDPRPTPDQVVDLALQVARGLHAAHQSGLIHRDIKPANIWVEEPSRRIKVLDFGLARPLNKDEGLTQCGTVLGTLAYMAPEQADGKVADPRSDLFSLGCVLYEVGCGKKPFEGSSEVSVLKATALHDPTPLHDLAPALPAEFCELVMQCLAKEPEGRPASATEVIETLEAIADATITISPKRGSRTSKAPIVKPGKTKQRGSRIARVALLAGLLLAGALFAPVILSYQRNGGATSTSADDPASSPLAPRPSPLRSIAQGVTEDEIVLGISAPFSGPPRELGRGMEMGIKTYFRHVNDAGGIAGRKPKLIALDDGYEPDRALANMKDLCETRRAFAVIGNVGTPTAEKALPYALSKQMIFFGAFTGANLLRRDPPDRYVFNYRASYAEETAAIVNHLMAIKKIRPEQIAVFAQQDGYGDAGFNGVAKALRTHGRQREDILRVGHVRNSTDISDAVAKILKHNEIRAVVTVSTYRQVASFIRQVKDAKRDLIFTNVSFVGSDALAEELRQFGPVYSEGVIVTQVVPHPASHASAVLKYRELLQKYFPSEQPSFISLEGYVAAALFVEGLRRAGDNLTTETLVDALETIRGVDVGLGTPLNFGPSEHQASHKVWGSVLDASAAYQILELE